jgi:hypothetical protein
VEVLRNNRRAALLIGAGLVLALVAALLLLHGSKAPERDKGVVGTTPGSTGGGSVPLPKAEKHGKAASRARSNAAPATGGIGFSTSLAGLGTQGLPGGTLEKPLKEMHIRLSLSSDHPIGWLGWIVPTSKEAPVGKRTGVGRSWSMSTVGYGRPDYARLFFMSGPVGSVTCTITVNGRVTEHRTTKGPYDQMMCQG